ncbi:MAG: YybH family protein [Pirellulaceae bacterium]
MARSTTLLLACVVLTLFLGRSPQAVWGQETAAARNSRAATTEAGPTASDTETAAVRAVSEALVRAYNAGDRAKLAACFLPKAELIDDLGTVYRGVEEITAIFQRFREQFPKATMELTVEAIRLAGEELAVEDGTRTVKTQDATAVNKYTMIYVKREGKWLVAAARETAADPEPTSHERLLPLAWLVGEWVDENAEAALSITCQWDDNQNFLLIDFQATVEGKVVMRSGQRIGWDPHAKRIRSWVFDSDGGYGEGRWANVNGIWVIKSTAAMPDGDSGSATLYLEPVDEDKFLMKGFDRVLGDTSLPDFEAVIVRKPPQPRK